MTLAPRQLRITGTCDRMWACFGCAELFYPETTRIVTEIQLKMRKVLTFFAIAIAAGVLGFAIWYRWHVDPQLGRQRLPEIEPIAEFNHGAWIQDVAISPVNPNLVASVGENNVIKVWNRDNTNTPVLTLTDHPGKDGRAPSRLDYIAFSPTGERLISKDFWTLVFWDVSSGTKISVFEMVSEETAVSPDGHRLATSSLAEVTLWDIQNPKEIKKTVVLPRKMGRPPLLPETARSVRHQDERRSWVHRLIDFSSDGKWVAAAGAMPEAGVMPETGRKIPLDTVQVWDLQRKQLVKILPRELPKHIRLSPNTFYADIRSIRFSPDNRFFACAGEAGYTIWTLPEWHIHSDIRSQIREKVDVVGDKEVRTRRYIQRFDALAFSPDSKMYAVADLSSPVTLWSLENNTPIALLKGGGFLDSVRALVFSRDGRTLAGGGMGGIVRLWDVSEVQSELP